MFGVKSFIMIGLTAMLFFVLAKVIFTKWEVPYVSQFVQSA